MRAKTELAAQKTELAGKKGLRRSPINHLSGVQL
jgi:hypothetical protein